MAQIIFKAPDELASRIDEAVAAGSFDSRSALVRIALEQLLARLDGEADVAAYQRQPIAEGEFILSDGSGVDRW